MREVLQENQVVLGKNDSTITVLIHGESHELEGDYQILSAGSSGNNALSAVVGSFEYVIAVDNSNYVIHKDDLPAFELLLKQSKKSGNVQYSFRIVDGKGKIKQVTGWGSLKQKLSSRIADLAFESSPLGIIGLKSVRNDADLIADFEVVVTNQRAENLLGIPLAEKKYSDIQAVALPDLDISKLAHVVEAGESHIQKVFYNRKRTWLTLTTAKFDDGVFIVIADDTRDRYNEDQMKHQTSLVTKVIESSPDIIEIASLQSGRSVYINKMLLEELNYPFEEIKKIENEKQMKSLIHPDDIELYHNFLAQILTADNNATTEVQIRWQSYRKGWKWFKTRARIFERDQKGIPVKILSFSQDITQQKQAEEEKKKHMLLKEMEKARTAFFSNVSHEFRTPITLLLAPLQELIKENQSKPDFEKLQMAYRNALRLQKLVNAILDFSRIEAGKLDAVFRPTDISTLTTDLASNFRSLVEHAGLKFSVKCPPVEEPIYLNREMYEKIIFNLISNAFKFTFHGKIEVAIKDNKNHVKVIVRDTGIGIEPANLEKIFDRFVRIPVSKARTYEGSGIGLALVRELIVVHRGFIKVESDPGAGTTFTMTFLKGKDHLPPKSIFEYTNEPEGTLATAYVEELKGWTVGFSGIEDNRVRRRRTDFGGERPHILVVDDNADMRTYLKNLLSDDYKVTVVPNGKAAIESITPQQMPDLILSDIMMPEADGYELLKTIKANEATKDIPVILLSAKAEDESRIEGMHLRADDYLVKPFSSSEMLARIEARIQIAQANRRVRETLRDQNILLEQRINEKTHTLEDVNALLVDKNSELENLTSDLSTFAFVASHDLREPLRKIQIFTRMLLEREGSLLTDKAKDVAQKIVASAERMDLLIENILIYSHTHEDSEQFEKVDLNKILTDVILDLAALIKEESAVIKHDPLPTLKGSALQFSQLFQNLLSNSLKFHPPGVRPEIFIKSNVVKGEAIEHPLARKDKEYVCVEIKDNGIGFEQKYGEKIFQMFQRLHSRTQYAGTGMGLAICKKIVERHGGFILSRSEPDKGATFCCYFPDDLMKA